MAAPKRELFKSAEVCEIARLQPYVLRSWESEFPSLGQTPTGGGARVYRRSDVELVLRIKQLVFGEGLTLAGARRRLEEQAGDPAVSPLAVEDVLGDVARARLREIRSGLQSILDLLDRRSPPELQLVPPAVIGERRVTAASRGTRTAARSSKAAPATKRRPANA